MNRGAMDSFPQRNSVAIPPPHRYSHSSLVRSRNPSFFKCRTRSALVINLGTNSLVTFRKNLLRRPSFWNRPMVT